MDHTNIRICVAGATGWAGSALVKTVLASSEFTLTGALARQSVGEDIGTRLGGLSERELANMIAANRSLSS